MDIEHIILTVIERLVTTGTGHIITTSAAAVLYLVHHTIVISITVHSVVAADVTSDLFNHVVVAATAVGCSIAEAIRETQILGNTKSVSVWQQKFSKIVECRTFDLINYAREYVKLDKMVESTTLDNLGTPRTKNWLVNINFFIRLITREFNFRGIRLFRKF